MTTMIIRAIWYSGIESVEAAFVGVMDGESEGKGVTVEAGDAVGLSAEGVCVAPSVGVEVIEGEGVGVGVEVGV